MGKSFGGKRKFVVIFEEFKCLLFKGFLLIAPEIPNLTNPCTKKTPNGQESQFDPSLKENR